MSIKKEEVFKKEILNSMPNLYSQEKLGNSAIVHLVARIPSTDYTWLLTEYDNEDGLFFGYCCINDIEMSELSYVSLQDLQSILDSYPLTVEQTNIVLEDAKEKYLNIKKDKK